MKPTAAINETIKGRRSIANTFIREVSYYLKVTKFLLSRRIEYDEELKRQRIQSPHDVFSIKECPVKGVRAVIYRI